MAEQFRAGSDAHRGVHALASRKSATSLAGTRSGTIASFVAALLTAAITVAAVTGFQPSVAYAVGTDCGSYLGYHYAGQYTSHTNGLTQCAPYDGYFGWNGVNGQITTPSSNPALPNYVEDHRGG